MDLPIIFPSEYLVFLKVVSKDYAGPISLCIKIVWLLNWVFSTLGKVKYQTREKETCNFFSVCS